ncbi:MAG: caspase family protein [Candidatus Cloacimonetes bacterium]|nr:caspase family protein [Candidatus Cloacimonadota bacterium]
MKIIFIVIFLIIIGGILLAASEAILQVDTGGHKAMIRDLIVSSDGTKIISASDDKTIRVWNVIRNWQTTEIIEERKILGEINSYEGAVYAIALSPDDKFLAAGGSFPYSNSEYSNIRIYEFQSGKLIQLLQSHTNTLNDLSFSDDGKYLVSCACDNSVKVWKNTAGIFSLATSWEEHSDDVYAVKMFRYGSDYRIVSAGYDGSIYLYSLKDGLLRSQKCSSRMNYLAVSSDYIAASGLGSDILIFDLELHQVDTAYSESEACVLDFSANENYLLTGCLEYPYSCGIYQANNEFAALSYFREHDNAVIAGAFLDNDIAITAGGNNNEIMLSDVQSAELIACQAGAGKCIWGVGISGSSIAFGSTWTATLGRSELQKVINLKDFSVIPISSSDHFNQIPRSYGDYELQCSAGGDYGYEDAVLQIKKNNALQQEIVRSSFDGLVHNCYGFTDNGVIITGGSGGFLAAYNLEGKFLADFAGHSGEIWSLAVDDGVLVSGSGDQTIKLWDISQINSNSSPVTIYPFLSIFVSQTDEWVVWSPEGYYNCSIEGDKFVGYHINHGADKAAEYLSSERFYKTYFQPELIAEIVTLKNEDKAIVYTQSHSRLELVQTDNILPPHIQLNCSEQLSTDNGSVTIEFTVVPQSDHEITAISIFLNGRDIRERGLKMKRRQSGNTIHISKEISLSEKDNTIKITAENRYSVSNPVYISATNIEPKIEDIFKPSLYLLAIGISNYQISDYNLNYAASDARTIIDIFANEKGLYYKVDHRLLTDSDATKDNILDGIDWIMREATQHDVVILYLAGHGINDANNNFYFMSYEADAERLRSTAVRFSEFQDVVVNLPAKVILMTDACYSGNIMGSKTSRSITTALKDLIAAGTGQIIMTATTNNAVAYEDKAWQHGAFTKALEEGLKYYKADYNKDDMITIKEIDLYITNKVNNLTNGNQKPTTIIPASIPDFPIITK